MMKENSVFKSLIIFAVLAACSYGLYEYQFADEFQWQFKPFTKGYALFDSEIQITDEKGVIHTTIKAPEIIYYADSEQTTIKQPKVNYFVSGEMWQVNSNEANINSDQSEIFFPNAVSMVAMNEDQPATLNTSALTLFPEQQKAQTAASILWTQAAMRMTGIGSVINLNLQEIEVLDEMHAEINP